MKPSETDTACRMELMQDAHRHEELRRAVRRFLREIRFVPFRAVDCDQDRVDEAWHAVKDALRAPRRRSRGER